MWLVSRVRLCKNWRRAWIVEIIIPLLPVIAEIALLIMPFLPVLALRSVVLPGPTLLMRLAVH